MTTNQYNSFKKELKDFGYAYYPDQPYEGRNVWIKYLVGKGIRKAFIRIDEYRSIVNEHMDAYFANR